MNLHEAVFNFKKMLVYVNGKKENSLATVFSLATTDRSSSHNKTLTSDTCTFELDKNIHLKQG